MRYPSMAWRLLCSCEFGRDGVYNGSVGLYVVLLYL
jgi:hypothetical protein